MLSDRFFEEYAKTAAPRPESSDDPPELPDKDSYTRAEVDEIVAAKVAEAVEEIRGELSNITKEQNNTPADKAE